MSGRKRVVGVMGGMGPDATVDFFAKLVAATHAQRDQDHLRIVIDNDPTLPDRTAAILGRGPDPSARLAAMARGLIAQGAEVLAMPCNTAHAFRAAILAEVGDVPFVDLIHTTVAATRTRLPGVARVGLLATHGTLSARLYHDAYERAGIAALTPNPADQADVVAGIDAVKGGRVTDAVRAGVVAAAARLVEAGAEAVIAACTEIPLLLRDGDLIVAGRSVPVIASTDALVAEVAARAGA